MKKKKILRTKNAGNLITNHNKPYFQDQFETEVENYENSGKHTDEEFYGFMVQEVMKFGKMPIEDAVEIVNKSIRKWRILKQGE